MAWGITIARAEGILVKWILGIFFLKRTWKLFAKDPWSVRIQGFILGIERIFVRNEALIQGILTWLLGKVVESDRVILVSIVFLMIFFNLASWLIVWWRCTAGVLATAPERLELRLRWIETWRVERIIILEIHQIVLKREISWGGKFTLFWLNKFYK